MASHSTRVQHHCHFWWHTKKHGSLVTTDLQQIWASNCPQLQAQSHQNEPARVRASRTRMVLFKSFPSWWMQSRFYCAWKASSRFCKQIFRGKQPPLHAAEDISTSAKHHFGLSTPRGRSSDIEMQRSVALAPRKNQPAQLTSAQFSLAFRKTLQNEAGVLETDFICKRVGRFRFVLHRGSARNFHGRERYNG